MVHSAQCNLWFLQGMAFVGLLQLLKQIKMAFDGIIYLNWSHHQYRRRFDMVVLSNSRTRYTQQTEAKAIFLPKITQYFVACLLQCISVKTVLNLDSIFCGVVCIVSLVCSFSFVNFLFFFFFWWREGEESCTNYMIEMIIVAFIYLFPFFHYHILIPLCLSNFGSPFCPYLLW